MITYDSNYFGVTQLLKLNGSAVYRTLIPAIVSTFLMWVYKKIPFIGHNLNAIGLHDERIVEGYEGGNAVSYFAYHPFVITIYIMAFSLIMNHRLNYCYQRYWESCGNIFQMTSKWVDSATTLAAFHYQSKVYDKSRPRSFGDHLMNMDDNRDHSTTGGNTRTTTTVLNTINDNDNDDDDEDDDTDSWPSSSSSSSSPGLESESTSRDSRTPSFVAQGSRERHRSSSTARQSSIVTGGVVGSDRSDTSNSNTNKMGGVGILRRMFLWKKRKGKTKETITRDGNDNNNINNNTESQKNKNNDDVSSFFFIDQKTSGGGDSRNSNSTTNNTVLKSGFSDSGTSSSRTSTVSFADVVKDSDKSGNSNSNSNRGTSRSRSRSRKSAASYADVVKGSLKKSTTSQHHHRHHRRKPSTDVPLPGDVYNDVKSFTPNPSLAWQKENRVAMPRNTGLHSTIIESCDYDFEKLLLEQERRRKKRKRQRRIQQLEEKIELTSTRSNESNKSGNNSEGKGRGRGEGFIAACRRTSLPAMNWRQSIALTRLEASDTIDSYTDSNQSNSNHSQGQGHSLFPVPELCDLPSLHKKNANSLESFYSSVLPSKSLGKLNSSSSINRSDGGSDCRLKPPVENMNGRASLFLQEAAHLFSLMSAVCFASLRADMEGCTSPLKHYVPGQKFPSVNPDEMTIQIIVEEDKEGKMKVEKENNASMTSLNLYDESDDLYNEKVMKNTNNDDGNNRDENYRSTGTFGSSTHEHDPTTVRIERNSNWTNFFLFLCGMSRDARQRTIYNASRPFSVLGGISDQELEMLRNARGHAAQHNLCTMWLKEFMTREHLHGSTGNIAPPIMARCYQYLSDGTTCYHQCRKTAFTDFPFPHAQLTSFFVLVNIFIFPLLYYEYVENMVFGMVLNFFTTMCFVGLQEVAFELEEPFIRYPNDLPLNNYQAQFNEALISSLYGGFHPDSWGRTCDHGGIFKTENTSTGTCSGSGSSGGVKQRNTKINSNMGAEEGSNNNATTLNTILETKKDSTKKNEEGKVQFSIPEGDSLTSSSIHNK